MRVFVYKDYKRFINDYIGSQPNAGRGERRRIATHLNCQMSYITHVLSGEKDFNQEQILSLTKYLGLSKQETDYLVHLLSFNRAGTADLKSYFADKLEEIRSANENLKVRLSGEGKLKFEEEVIYYSSWIYGAIHMASTIPRLRRLENFANALNIDEASALEVAQRLAQMQLIELGAREISPGKKHLFLERGSPLLRQMHASWRNKVIDLLNNNRIEDLHFTNCFSVATKDLPKVREIFVQAIAKALEIIRPSKEEDLAVLCIDLHKMTK